MNKRKAIENLILIIIMIWASAVHFGYISAPTPTHEDQKARETITILHQEECKKSLKLQLDLKITPLKYYTFINKMQKQGYIRHYPCGFKNTFLTQLYIETIGLQELHISQQDKLSFQEPSNKQSSQELSYLNPEQQE